jgi:hypothetical protein
MQQGASLPLPASAWKTWLPGGVFPCVLMLIHDLIYPRMLGHYYVYVIYYMY